MLKAQGCGLRKGILTPRPTLGLPEPEKWGSRKVTLVWCVAVAVEIVSSIWGGEPQGLLLACVQIEEGARLGRAEGSWESRSPRGGGGEDVWTREQTL